uniref:Uncharacterized protein n=1 Tax=Setaria viridis TaxID=4556 RepID=A0A4U6V6M7_SETVI|nr:hypothetical protein SEVIR_3G078850v2 [Setaria viridis]
MHQDLYILLQAAVVCRLSGGSRRRAGATAPRYWLELPLEHGKQGDEDEERGGGGGRGRRILQTPLSSWLGPPLCGL